MPIRALPPPVPFFSWTGFYLGAHVGYDWQDSSAAGNPLPSPAAFGVAAQTGSTNGSSMLGGIHGGFNYEFWGAWVAGVEGDFSWTKAGTNSTLAWVTPAGLPVGGGAATAMNTTLNDLSSVRGRLWLRPLAERAAVRYGWRGVGTYHLFWKRLQSWKRISFELCFSRTPPRAG